MEMKIMLAAAVFLGGWLWAYLFARQFLFNILTAKPLIKKMRALQEDLIAVGADRYTTISLITCLVISALILFVIVFFCPLYLIQSFGVGASLAVVLLINKLGPGNRPMFDAFCSAYCRFVPDDALRTAMYNKKPGQIKARLKAMGIQGSFVPDFKP